MFCCCKIKKELKEFKEFKKNFKFEYKEIEEKKDGSKYIDGELVVDTDGNTQSSSEKWINVGYKLHGPEPKVLSNLFPYTFRFRGHKVASIESIFQGFKFKDKKMQKMLFKLYGMDSNCIKVAGDHDWKTTRTVYFQGKAINRDNDEFVDFIDEMYISALQNPLYRNVLKNIKKTIIHSIGTESKQDTVFTRYEFEYQLNCLKAFVQSKENK